MKKIVYVATNLSSGGQERQLVELLKGLNNINEYDIHLILFSSRIHYSIDSLNIKLHIIEQSKRKDLSLFAKLYLKIREIKPDIVHAWGTTPAAYVAFVKMIYNKFKFVNGYIRNAYKPKIFDNYWLRAKLTFPVSNIVVANSKAGLKAYKIEKKGICIYNGFDFSQLKKLIETREIKVRHDIITKYCVGMVAHLSKYKDYDTFFKAAKTILNKRSDITFIAIGKNYQGDKYFKEIKGYEERIKIIGEVTNVEDYIDCFDIGVLMSNPLNHAEGISNSIMEYMALKKPVIASSGGGTNEIVRDGFNGYLIEPLSPANLANKIEELIDNREKRHLMGNNGYSFIKKSFSIDLIVDSYLKLYRNLL